MYTWYAFSTFESGLLEFVFYTNFSVCPTTRQRINKNKGQELPVATFYDGSSSAWPLCNDEFSLTWLHIRSYLYHEFTLTFKYSGRALNIGQTFQRFDLPSMFFYHSAGPDVLWIKHRFYYLKNYWYLSWAGIDRVMWTSDTSFISGTPVC